MRERTAPFSGRRSSPESHSLRAGTDGPTIHYIYEGHSEIITTLIDCFSELNKHTRSYPETELACHQDKTHHFSYYSWAHTAH